MYAFLYGDYALVDSTAMAAGGAQVSILVGPYVEPDHGGGCGPHPAVWSSVASTNPAVVSFTKLDDQDIQAVTGQPGDAELQLQDDSGTVIDHVQVHVRAVNRLDLDGQYTPLLAAGSQFVACVRQYADLTAVVGGTVQWSSGGTLSFAGKADIDWQCHRPSEGMIVSGQPGTGTLSVSTPGGVRAQRDFTFVSPSAIDQVKVNLEVPIQLTTSTVHTVTADAYQNGQQVVGPPITWSANPTVRIRPDVVTMMGLWLMPLRKADFELVQPGDYALTATITGGTATATVKAHR